jgi:hypothetical protein
LALCNFCLAVAHISKCEALCQAPLIHHVHSLSLAVSLCSHFCSDLYLFLFLFLLGSCQAHTVQSDSAQHQVWAMWLLLLKKPRTSLGRDAVGTTHHMCLYNLEMLCGRTIDQWGQGARSKCCILSLCIASETHCTWPLRLPLGSQEQEAA